MAAERRGYASDDDGGLFPWFVTVASLLLACLLFFRSTVPAMTERRELDRVEQRLERDLRRLRDATELERRRRASLPTNPEAMLLEFDRHGRLPPDPLERAR